MKKPQYRRTRLWVDGPFQCRLLLRLGLYFVLFTLIVVHVGFVFEITLDVPRHNLQRPFGDMYLDFLARQRALLYGLVVALPIFLYDLLKFSHRIAGPLFRCRRVMQEMAAGKVVPEFKPRKGDLMGELFQAFNGLIKACNARLAPDRKGAAAAASAEATPAPANGTPAEPEKVGF